MSFCRFCGKELVNGQCDCKEFQESIGNTANTKDTRQQYQEPYQKRHEPFLVQSFHPNFSSFSGLISSVRDQTGISEASSAVGDPYEYNVPIIPDCVQAEENEIIVKQYNIARLRTRLKFMKAEGRLMVTNRRLLFRAAGTSLTGNLLQEHQFNLDELAGIEMHKDYKFSFLNLFGSILIEMLSIFLAVTLLSKTGNGGTIAVGVILGFLGLVPTFIVYKHQWLKLLSAAISVACFMMAIASSTGGVDFLVFLTIVAFVFYLIDLIIVCFVPNFVMKIKTKGATNAIVIGSQKSLFRRQTGDDYSGFAEVMPWEDTVMAINELGTMIDDLQKQGDYAVEKWSK